MNSDALSDFVKAMAAKFGMPGAAAGVLVDGREAYGLHGVTSTENPLPVDQDTLFILASVSKTYTATAMMRLVAQGRVELGAPVRRYVPELRLSNERAAADITVLNLLNHTSGLSWALITDTGEGDDALARYVAMLPELELIAPPGERTSYSQAGYNLAGRIIEKVTGQTFEGAIASLVLEPLGLSHSFYARDDIMTRRFAVGHNRDQDGVLSVARSWRRSRSDNPGGGLASSVSDQLRWARFHLGTGPAESGERVLPAEAVHQMQEPTAKLMSSSLGQAVGVSWFLRDIDGVRTIGHGGSANGQFADLLIVPDRSFAVVALCNAGPDGIAFNQEIIRWALDGYLGIADRDPDPLPYDAMLAQQVCGHYENEAMTLTIDTDRRGLRLEVRLKPEVRAAAGKEAPPDYPPFDFGLLPGDKYEYVVTSGALKGQRGLFTRDDSGTVIGVDLAGRVFSNVSAADRPDLA
jgi:CubicO group peptidase (beta-lactamase class C family)